MTFRLSAVLLERNTQYRRKDVLISQNIFLLLNIQKTTNVDITISSRAIIHDQLESPSHPNCTFIPKKLAMSVGGMSINETRVNTFIILF